jgi:predicted O-linked N-acetylglucosamine transferase (SPINDLY family)
MDERIGAFVEYLATEDADPGPPPALSNGYLTFGFFDSVRKINDEVLRRWSLAFKALPDSRLRMGVASNAGQRRIVETLDALGMKKDRIEFVGELSRAKRLGEYRAVDVCLDTLPFCGQETTLDAIWMGTPVITQAGKTATGRMGWSFANNLGLTDLAARNDDEFAEIAAGLGRDISRLSELRRTLRARLLQSPIMDAPAYTRDVEAAYRQMWKDWVKK